MRRRTVLIAVVLVLGAALWGWRSGAVRVVEEASRIGSASEQAPAASAGSPSQPPVGSATDAVVTTAPAASASTAAPASTIAAATASPAGDVPAARDGTVRAAVPDSAPGFDVVRVEPDGSAVIAGRAKPGEVVTLRSGETALAAVRAGPSGEFVLDLTLPAGEHRLQLSDAANALSREAAVVSVPKPGRPSDLLVLMDRPGQPAEILAGPQLASRSSADPAAPERPVDPVDATASGTPATVRAVRSTLGVEAVEVENRRLSVAGAAPEGSRLKIYLDGKLVGEAGGAANDRFIANAMADVSVGSHTVRIDEVGRDGTVVARAEVPFTRPDDSAMAAIAPAPPAAAARPDDQSPVADATPTAELRLGSSEASVDIASGEETGPATIVQPALQAAQAKVIIRRGDSLWRISRRAYGQGVRYTVIYLANGDQIRNPDRIYPGQVFRMPDDNGRPPRS